MGCFSRWTRLQEHRPASRGDSRWDINLRRPWVWLRFRRQCGYAVWSISLGGRAASAWPGSVWRTRERGRERERSLAADVRSKQRQHHCLSLPSLPQPGRNTITDPILFYIVQRWQCHSCNVHQSGSVAAFLCLSGFINNIAIIYLLLC